MYITHYYVGGPAKRDCPPSTLWTTPCTLFPHVITYLAKRIEILEYWKAASFVFCCTKWHAYIVVDIWYITRSRWLVRDTRIILCIIQNVAPLMKILIVLRNKEKLVFTVMFFFSFLFFNYFYSVWIRVAIFFIDWKWKETSDPKISIIVCTSIYFQTMNSKWF